MLGMMVHVFNPSTWEEGRQMVLCEFQDRLGLYRDQVTKTQQRKIRQKQTKQTPNTVWSGVSYVCATVHMW